jgi:hypothetical protein
VTDPKLETGLFNADRIADGSLDAATLSEGLAAQYQQMSLTNLNNANYGPASSNEVAKWRYNATSLAAGSLTAGASNRAAVVVDWGSYCRLGLRLEARGRYTVYSPANTVTVAARLLSFADTTNTNPSAGAPFASTTGQSVPVGTYKTLVSGWDVVDLGNCGSSNYLLSSVFLYLLLHGHQRPP